MKHDDSYVHHDALSFLSQKGSLHEKIVAAHSALQKEMPFVARVALTLYDTETRVLKTYLHSSGEDMPLECYQTLIDDAPSLKDVLKRGQPRVIDNLQTSEQCFHEHTRRIGRQGYASSYTLPMFNSGEFIGFLFFNSYESKIFTEQVLQKLDVYGHLIALMVINELSSISMLGAAIKTTGHISHLRDPETGSHLDRMSRYSRLIALELAEKHDLSDEYIEHVFMFAPLHDIGKIGIPDNILLKPDRLTDQEMSVMKTHVSKGRAMIDDILVNFGLENIDHVDILRHIAYYHHEAVNGTGYPEQISGNGIPLEARIVAVADIFDALTSVRPYKEAWSNDEAFTMLQKLAGEKLDQECVDALLSRRQEIENIQCCFKENIYT